MSQTAAMMRLGPDPRLDAVQGADRRIFAFMAAFIMATIFVGFIPDSLEMTAAVESSQRAPFPLVLHVHAVLMGSKEVLQ